MLSYALADVPDPPSKVILRNSTNSSHSVELLWKPPDYVGNRPIDTVNVSLKANLPGRDIQHVYSVGEFNYSQSQSIYTRQIDKDVMPFTNYTASVSLQNEIGIGNAASSQPLTTGEASKSQFSRLLGVHQTSFLKVSA